MTIKLHIIIKEDDFIQITRDNYASTEKAQEMLDNKAKAISQQISALGMQLIQVQKMNSESGSV